MIIIIFFPRDSLMDPMQRDNIPMYTIPLFRFIYLNTFLQYAQIYICSFAHHGVFLNQFNGLALTLLIWTNILINL